MESIYTDDDIARIVNNAEITLNECFNMLLSMKNVDDKLENTLFNFQPTLADCLYSLMSIYNDLNSQKKTLIDQKTILGEDVFANRIRVNAKQLGIIRDCISIGLSLGDAYAWFFFNNNREELDFHLLHPSNGLFPAKVGGKGEIEFLKRNMNLDGLYVVYHSITDMLRIGDFSLFANGIGIVGNGEIKSQQKDNRLEISASIYTKLDIKIPDAEQSTLSAEERMNQMINSFPRLLHQMKKQEQLLTVKKSDYSSEFVAEYEYDIVNKLSVTTPMAHNSDDSLLLYARWSKYQNLYDVLSIDESNELPKELSDNVKKLIQPNSNYNAIYYGDFDLKMLPSRIPVFWWKINDEICRDIYFRRASITSIYNPASLLEMFVAKGFEVASFGNSNELKLVKMNRNEKIEFNNLYMFLDLISKNLMDTKTAFESAYEVISAIERGEVPVNTKIDLHIHPGNFKPHN